MFEKVLIANRGEIALRVARACRSWGSSRSPSTRPPTPSRRSSASPTRRSASGRRRPGRATCTSRTSSAPPEDSGADALHPGYGFLSEDPYFAEICADEGITFIGPKPDVMEKVGDKAIARDLMKKAGLPLLPGTVDPVGTADEAQEIADSIGYPVIIKAVAGGGGRGMNVVSRGRGPGPPLPDDARHGAGGLQGQRRLHRALPRGARATPRSSSSATSTATASTSSSATARCSAATRS